MQQIMGRLKSISKKYHAPKAILYGFYARGEAIAESDIDRLDIAPTTERFFERMASESRLL